MDYYCMTFDYAGQFNRVILAVSFGLECCLDPIQKDFLFTKCDAV